MNMFINDYWFLPDKKRTGKKIEEIQEKSGCSNFTFSNSIGTNYKTFCSWKNGESMPSIMSLMKIKEEYKVSLEDLILPDSKFINSNIDINKLIERTNGDSGIKGWNLDNYFYTYINISTNKKISLDDYVKLKEEALKEGELYPAVNFSLENIEFDSNDYPLPIQKVDLDKLKRLIGFCVILNMVEDFTIQKNLFSIETKENDDDTLKKIKEKYGNSYRIYLTDFNRNSILYDYYLYTIHSSIVSDLLKDI